MKNRKLRKILLTICSAMLLVTLSVGATFAYLTSTTETVVNTFTVGKVAITLDETDVDVYGKKDGDTRVQENSYKLLPGHSYIKDPIVHVAANSEDAYIRMLVTVEGYDKLKAAFKVDTVLLQNYVTGWDNSVWTSTNEIKVADEGKSAVYEFRYANKVNTLDGQAKDLPALFQTVVMPGTLTNADIAQLDGVKINVVAHAMQADGFPTADLAWAEWN